jgi:hypothetical protein
MLRRLAAFQRQNHLELGAHRVVSLPAGADPSAGQTTIRALRMDFQLSVDSFSLCPLVRTGTR